MKRVNFFVPLFVLAAVAILANSALAGSPMGSAPVPEPSSIIVFAGLGAAGVIGFLLKSRRRGG